MDRKMLGLILVVLISFCFLGIVVADNATDDGGNATDHNQTSDNDKVDENKTADTDKTSDNNKTADKHKNKTDDKPKIIYILAKGKGNDIKFSDGFRGFILDYSKSPASSGDKFKHASTSKLSNANKLKLAVIECYKQNSTDKIAKIIADFVKTGSSKTKIGKAVEASHKKIGDHEVVKINNHTEAIFDFEVLKSVSGNESDYFAYKVSFKSISGGEKNRTVNLTNNQTNVTNMTNTTNATNTTNVTNLTPPGENETNSTFLDDLYNYLAFLANALYDVWKPIIDSLINDLMMIVNAIEELVKFFEDIMAQIQALIDAVEEFLKILESLWEGIEGLFKLLGILLTAVEQLLNMIGALLYAIGQIVGALLNIVAQLLNLLGALLNAIAQLIGAILDAIGQLLGAIWNLISSLISAIVSLIQQILGLLSGLINFILDLVNQILSALQAILDFLKSVGSGLVNVIENGAIIIGAFVVITIGAFFYNRIR